MIKGRKDPAGRVAYMRKVRKQKITFETKYRKYFQPNKKLDLVTAVGRKCKYESRDIWYISSTNSTRNSFNNFCMLQVREEYPILYSHKTQLNIKLSLLLYYNITTTCFGLNYRPSSGAQKQLQPANRSHMITHQQTSPILPQTRSRYIPPTPSTQ